jgi:hypothetical protein
MSAPVSWKPASQPSQVSSLLWFQINHAQVDHIIRTLTNSILACADYVCAQCTDLGQTVLNNCCSQASPVQCFINGAGSGSGNGGGNPYITTQAPDPNLTACSTALNDITTCEAQTPGFSDLANTDEASCLCYDSNTSWDPNAFDLPWSSCVAWAKTADVSVYSELLGNAGMCASVGNILNAPTKGVVASTTVGGSTNGGETTSTSASKATPAGGSVTGTTATSTSSSTKATSSSAGSSIVNSIKGSLVVQVSSLRSVCVDFANKAFLSL